MQVGDKVKVLKGLMKGHVGNIEKILDYRGKKLYLVVERILTNSPACPCGWDKYRTTVAEDEIEQVV